VDLFDVRSGKDPQRHSSIWHLPVVKPFVRWDVVGVFNWTDRPARRTVDLSRLGLDPNDKYLVWDFWAQEPVSRQRGEATLELDVARTSCRLLVIHRNNGQPRLISSDRHLAVGVLDVDDVNWSGTDRRLSGRSSQLVAGAPFEYIFFVPPTLIITRARFGAEDGRVRSLGHGFYAVSFTAAAPRLDWELTLSRP
jgi:hypothetical protein